MSTNKFNNGNNSNKDFVFDYSSYAEFSSILEQTEDTPMDKYKSPFTYTSEKYTNLQSVEEELSPEGWLVTWLRAILTRLCFTLVIATFPISAFFCLKRVSPLQRMVVMRLGRLQPIRGPGLVVVLPGLDKSVMVDLASKTLQIEPLQVLTSDGGILSVAGVAEYRVADVAGYVMRSRHLETTLAQLLKTSLVSKAASAEQSDLLDRRDLLLNDVKVDVNSLVQLWGGEVLNFHLTSVQILQAAQPKDPLAPLINSLTSMFQSPTNATAAAPAACVPAAKPPSGSLVSREDLATWLQQQTKDKSQRDQITASFHLDLGPDPGFLVHLNQGDIKVHSLDSKNSKPPVDATLSLSADTLQCLVAGSLSVKDAYLDNKLGIDGASSSLNSGLMVSLFL